MSAEVSKAAVDAIVGALVDGWCERRNLRALRIILPAYPMPDGLSEDWYRLRDALVFVRAECRDALSAIERDQLEHVISLVDTALVRY